MASRKQAITFETEIEKLRKQTIIIENEIDRDFIVDLAITVESTIIFTPATHAVIVGDVGLSLVPESITSEPKAVIVTGDVGLSLQPESLIKNNFVVVGDISLSLISDKAFKADYKVNSDISLAFKTDIFSKIQKGDKYCISFNVIINGIDYTSVLVNNIDINKDANSVGDFSIQINSQREVIDFLDRDIKIDIQSTDKNGIIITREPLLIGKIRNVVRDTKSNIFSLSGFDYGGVHNSKGEFISKAITPIKKGQLVVTSSGTFSTGDKPIFSVNVKDIDVETEGIRDGKDYLVNPLTGEISLPISSKLLIDGNPVIFEYDYPDPFLSLEELINAIVDEKSWIIEKDNITIADYSDGSKQPIITLSDESIIDTTKKLLELSGGKIDTSNFPTLRVFSELNNFFGGTKKVFNYEDEIIDGTLNVGVSIDDYINKQIVNSANKVFPNIDLTNQVDLLKVGLPSSGTSGNFFADLAARQNSPQNWDNIYYDNGFGTDRKDAIVQAQQKLLELTTRSFVSHEIKGSNLSNIQLNAGGSFGVILLFAKQADIDDFDDQVRNIVDSDWKIEAIEGGIKLSLQVEPFMNEHVSSRDIFGLEKSGYFRVGYMGAFYTLDVKGQKLEYGKGTLDNNISVTACRPALGIGNLFGDTYENPYIETQKHAENIANAILLTRGNIYEASFQVPFHVGNHIKIGDKVEVWKDKKREISGLVKTIDYNLDLETGLTTTSFTVRGIK